MREFAEWAKTTRHLAWRPNLGNPVGLSWGMPDVGLAQAAEDFRFVAENHCMGLYFDMLWFHWATQGPYYYLVAHLAWDPRADARALMADYYRRGFGPAAGEIEAYWSLMERTRMEAIRDVPNRQRAFEIPRWYTPELLAKAEGLLDGAAAKVKDAAEMYRRRVAFVRSGLDYTRLVVDTRTWMQKVEQSKGADTDAVTRVKANWEKAAQMRTTSPPFAINWQAVFYKPSHRWMMGLHPDNPLVGRALREARSTGRE
jgi:hypothetical protein